MAPRIDLVEITGVFRDSDPPAEVVNNVWVIGDDDEVLVVDASHDDAPIVEAIGGRRVTRIQCSHGHFDHVNAARELQGKVDAPIALHPADRMLWDEAYPDVAPDLEVAAGDVLTIAGTDLKVMHTPGHTPGSVCLYDAGGHLFGGDCLFQGGPGATAFRYGDFEVIITSIREQLLVLPLETEVHTGHGPSTTIGDEAPHLDEWIARGY
jgi:glyoxylase-like metal-dependent hydrolase (beta-lactamase superfamily II)